MSLPKQNGSELYQGLKMRRRRSSRPLLVLEGKSDPISWANLIAPAAYLVAAGNRESVIAAHAQFMESGDPLGSAFFIIDCDNRTDPALLGLPSLAVTERRDIESDIIHSLSALERVLLPLLARTTGDIDLARQNTKEIGTFVSKLTSDLTLVLDAGRRLKLGVRLTRRNGNSYRLGIGDLPEAENWCRDLHTPAVHELIESVATALGWDRDKLTSVEDGVNANRDKTCRAHASSGCEPCRQRTFANGHDQVALLAGVFTFRLGQGHTAKEIEDRLRSAAYYHDDWALNRRIEKWENQTGSVLRSP